MTDVAVKRAQVVTQFKAVAALCKALGEVSAELATVYEAGGPSDRLLDAVGLRTASQMEIIGDMLSGMDAVEEEDAWMTPVFDKAHEMFPDAVRRMGWFGPVDAAPGEPDAEA